VGFSTKLKLLFAAVGFGEASPSALACVAVENICGDAACKVSLFYSFNFTIHASAVGSFIFPEENALNFLEVTEPA